LQLRKALKTALLRGAVGWLVGIGAGTGPAVAGDWVHLVALDRCAALTAQPSNPGGAFPTLL